MDDFKALTTLKSVNKDWESVRRVIVACKLNSVNVMLHSDNHEWLKGELTRLNIDYLTLPKLVLDSDLLGDIIDRDHRLDKVVISSTMILKAMKTQFTNRFFHIEVSHLRKSP